MCQWLSKALQVRIQVLIGKAVKAMTRLLTIQEVKEQLSLSRSSVYRLIDEKELERVYINSAPRVVSDSVEAFIQRLRTPKSAFTNEGQQS
jgi:excisionase family DNA binding protein